MEKLALYLALVCIMYMIVIIAIYDGNKIIKALVDQAEIKLESTGKKLLINFILIFILFLLFALAVIKLA